MEQPEDLGQLSHTMEAVAVHDEPAPNHTSAQSDISPIDMLRIKQQMFNQCFEMEVHLQTGDPKRTCSSSEAERDLLDFVTEIENAKTNYFNCTLALHRMQTWHALAEKRKQNDAEANELRRVSERCMALCSQTKLLQQESRALQDDISELQKKRLGICPLGEGQETTPDQAAELKRLTHEKMKEIEELKSKKEHPDSEKYKAVLEKGQANLEKNKKMAVMTQNVLRGLLLACKINWIDDPKLRDIAMTLEELPISD
ncbi:centromere protein H isoform X1 [Boleophthalmus pectinirostris]|uniref:centromere protein H isoform X1 n=1 Tax=Boleophthalmus pectinirostris TaxID=150288 RepID=UPI00242DFF10|nr:centromere protein H isoform X1 [Boleophthalmus pectinirostris]